LVKALNRVDFPTLGKPTMPHFKLIQISLKINPLCTIEPNVGIVKTPVLQQARSDG